MFPALSAAGPPPPIHIPPVGCAVWRIVEQGDQTKGLGIVRGHPTVIGPRIPVRCPRDVHDAVQQQEAAAVERPHRVEGDYPARAVGATARHGGSAHVDAGAAVKVRSAQYGISEESRPAELLGSSRDIKGVQTLLVVRLARASISFVNATTYSVPL